MDFQYVDYLQPHKQRGKEILEKHPEVRTLMGPNIMTFFFITLIVLIQVGVGFLVSDMSWWVVIIAAYFFGAFFSHGQFVLIHECCHHLVFKNKVLNRLAGIWCDVALVFPSAASFSFYHLIHHRHLGEYDYDPDIVSYSEGNLVKNSTFKKIIWMGLFMFSQGFMRPLKLLKVANMWNKWVVLNMIFIAFTDFLIFKFFGVKAIAYMILSTFFALGIHPLGGRWIQEHYLTNYPQETYSYYGIGNVLGFNIGYHNEHHDVMNIPWNNLPKLKKMAPEYYDHLNYYTSWSKVLFNFLFNPSMSPFSRVSRKKEVRIKLGEDIKNHIIQNNIELEEMTY